MSRNIPEPGATRRIADLLDLRHLERENRRRLSRCFVLAAGMLALLAVFSPPLFREMQPRQEQPYRTIVTDLIEIPAQPPSGPFLLKRPAPARRSLSRPERIPGIPSVAGKVKSPTVLTIGADIGSFDIDLNAPPGIKADTDSQARFSPGGEGFEDIGSVERVPKGEIKLTDELIDIGALDNGRWKALLIHEPGDTHNLKGFVHIPRGLRGATWSTPDWATGVVLGLAEATYRYTGIETKVDQAVYLNSPDLQKYPFLYFLMEDFFRFTKYEAKIFREYLTGGGFAVLDAFGDPDPVCGRPESAPAMMQMLSDVFGKNFRRTLTPADSADMVRIIDDKVGMPIRLQFIPSDHELYRCFLDVNIAGNQKVPVTDEKCGVQPVTHKEGIWYNRRLILVYSENYYGHQLYRKEGVGLG